MLTAFMPLSETTSTITGYAFSLHCVCKGNCLSELPSSVGSLSSLRTLDLSDNNIVQLPKALAYIRTLEVCIFIQLEES